MLQPAFVLHSRPYRETSLLVDVLTEEEGRMSLLSYGAKKQPALLKALLQPFTPLWIAWRGKTELMKLTTVEPSGVPCQLQGECLLSGLYLNELLMRVLPKQDPVPLVYVAYRETLLKLQQPPLQQKTLRLFEKKLLTELGYALPLERYSHTGKPISAKRYYQFSPDIGFHEYEKSYAEKQQKQQAIFSGKMLLALANEQLESVDCLQEAKQLMRLILAPLLGYKPLQSRRLFESYQSLLMPSK